MDNYRKKLDEMHAPESLIMATLNRIHEEEKQIEQEVALQSEGGIVGRVQQEDVLSASDKVLHDNPMAVSKVVQPEFGKGHRQKRNSWAGMIGVAAAVAVLFLVVGVNNANTVRMELIYNTVPETIVRSTLGEQTESEVDVDAFSEYLGVDIVHPGDNAELIKSELYMEYDGDKVIADEACAYYNVDGEQLMIRYSKTLDVVPEQLKSGEASEVNGLEIFAGVSENEKERVAAFERDGVRYFIMSNSMNQKKFEVFLAEFIRSE